MRRLGGFGESRTRAAPPDRSGPRSWLGSGGFGMGCLGGEGGLRLVRWEKGWVDGFEFCLGVVLLLCKKV